MQVEGSSIQKDDNACFARRRRWRRALTQPHPPTVPTPCLSALSLANADGKGVYSRRAVSLSLSVSHRVMIKKSSEEAYQTLQHILGCDGFDALWRGCGIAIVCCSLRSAKALARALTSCGWPAMMFTSGKNSSLVDDSGCLHVPRIFITTDVDIKSTLEETVAAATKAASGPGGDGILPNLLPMPVDILIHFELPKDFGTFLRRVERLFRGRLLEVNSALISVALGNEAVDDIVLPWVAALVSDADQVKSSPDLEERISKLKKSLAIDQSEDEQEEDEDVGHSESSSVADFMASHHQHHGRAASESRWDMFGTVGSVLSYNFGNGDRNGDDDDDDGDDDSDSEAGSRSQGEGDESSTLYVNHSIPKATLSPFIEQRASVTSSMLSMGLPMFSTHQQDEEATSESGSSGDEEF
jgi:hypothetical protein